MFRGIHHVPAGFCEKCGVRLEPGDETAFPQLFCEECRSSKTTAPERLLDYELQLSEEMFGDEVADFSARFKIGSKFIVFVSDLEVQGRGGDQCGVNVKFKLCGEEC